MAFFAMPCRLQANVAGCFFSSHHVGAFNAKLVPIHHFFIFWTNMRLHSGLHLQKGRSCREQHGQGIFHILHCSHFKSQGKNSSTSLYHYVFSEQCEAVSLSNFDHEKGHFTERTVQKNFSLTSHIVAFSSSCKK
jgi:hypothetical protein